MTDPGLDEIDVGREVAHEVVLGQPAEAMLVDDEIREHRRGRCVTAQGGDRLALVEPESGDVDEPDDIRRLVTERGHDPPAVGMPTTMVGPLCQARVWRRRATSSAREVNGNCGAVTS
jgi:hypothetical protein